MNPLQTLMQYVDLPVKYVSEGTHIEDSKGKMLLDVRGWGWIQHLEEEGEPMQDALGEYLAEKINELKP